MKHFASCMPIIMLCLMINSESRSYLLRLISRWENASPSDLFHMEETNVSCWPRLGVQSPQSPSPKKRGTKLIDFSIEFEQEEDGR
jgi:hypothetical protein